MEEIIKKRLRGYQIKFIDTKCNPVYEIIVKPGIVASLIADDIRKKYRIAIDNEPKCEKRLEKIK